MSSHSEEKDRWNRKTALWAVFLIWMLALGQFSIYTAIADDGNPETLLWLMIPTYCVVIVVYFGINAVSLAVVSLLIAGCVYLVLDKLERLPFLK